ncbi:MAG: cyclase family protein [Flavipsychrobacter sp.]|nr:cyclase family protein [Flavipsychrobacter sp.]
MKTNAKAIIGSVKVFNLIDQKLEITRNALKHLPIEKGDRVLLRTSNSDANTEYITAGQKHTYLSADAVRYLVEKQVSCLGIDYLLTNNSNAAEINVMLTDSSISMIQGLQLKGIDAGAYEMICLPVPGSNGATPQSRVILKPEKKPAVADYA